MKLLGPGTEALEGTAVFPQFSVTVHGVWPWTAVPNVKIRIKIRMRSRPSQPLAVNGYNVGGVVSTCQVWLALIASGLPARSRTLESAAVSTNV